MNDFHLVKEADQVFPEKKLLGKITINRLTGRFDLIDRTGSIPVAFLTGQLPNTIDNFIGQVVKLQNFW